MISRNMYKAVSVLMALVTAFTVTGLSGCKSRTVSNEVTAEYDTPDDYNDERPGVTYGNVDEISYYSPTTGSERKACVYLPRDYDESQRYPVVYLLHGMSGSYSEYNRIGALYVAQNAVDDYNRNPVIMVSFTVFTDADGGQESDYDFSELTAKYDACEYDVINALIPYINEHYSTRTGRENTAIAGYSLGGRESLFLCFAHPDVFGYVGAFAPVGGVVDTGSGERVYGNRGFLLPELVKDGGQQPLVTLIVAGDSDPYCKESAINYSDYMSSHGINHIFYIRPGAHEVSVWNNGLYNFIRRIF